ncbi:MAG: AAA family ATPase [Vulcanimicrobiota bacterium]
MASGECTTLYSTIADEMKKVIVGQEAVIQEILICLLSGGHVLLEGVPGTAKTLMAKTLSAIVKAEFKRVQFTPDLMPSDLTGTHIYDMRTQDFRLQKGPIFTNFLLADEINRTPPKTQSALLEAMEERQVTIEGETCLLPPLFMVFATQNPLEFEGTYPLPEAQIDRFMMKVLIDYPGFNEEREVVRKYHQGFNAHNLKDCNLSTVSLADPDVIAREISEISVSDPVIDYITEITRSTRKNSALSMGVSPRGSICLLLCSKVLAALNGREFVIPDDIKRVAYPVLRHRMMIKPEAELDGVNADEVIKNILRTVNVPR